MKVTIRSIDPDKELQLEDDSYADDNLITIEFCTAEGPIEFITVAMSDLMPALIAFDAKRSRRLSEENSNQSL